MSWLPRRLQPHRSRQNPRLRQSQRCSQIRDRRFDLDYFSKYLKKIALTGIRTRVDRLGSGHTNHCTISAPRKSTLQNRLSQKISLIQSGRIFFNIENRNSESFRFCLAIHGGTRWLRTVFLFDERFGHQFAKQLLQTGPFLAS